MSQHAKIRNQTPDILITEGIIARQDRSGLIVTRLLARAGVIANRNEAFGRILIRALFSSGLSIAKDRI